MNEPMWHHDIGNQTLILPAGKGGDQDEVTRR